MKSQSVPELQVFDNPRINKFLVATIAGFPGIKASEIVCKAVPFALNNDIEADIVIPALNNLVEKRAIIEVEYVQTFMNYRVKSLYFPKGTMLDFKFPDKDCVITDINRNEEIKIPDIMHVKVGNYEYRRQ